MLYNQISVYTVPVFHTHATFVTLIKRYNMYLVYPSSALISELSIITQIIFVGKAARIYIHTYLRTNRPILRRSVTQTTYNAMRVFQSRTNIRHILEVSYSDQQLNHNPHAAPTIDNTPAGQMKHTCTKIKEETALNTA